MRLTDETYSCYLTLSLKRGLPEVRGAPQSGEGMSSSCKSNMSQMVLDFWVRCQAHMRLTDETYSCHLTLSAGRRLSLGNTAKR